MGQESKAHGTDTDRGLPAHRVLDEARRVLRGGSELPAVRRYVAAQKEHHRRVSYDEVVLLLHEHGVACDSRYLWD